MKKTVSILLLFCCLLSSCGTGTTDDDIAANLENYESLYGETSPGDTETEYVSVDTTGVEGIISSDWAIRDGKYYFCTKRRDKKGQVGVEMITYVDLATGESHIICQDPLCEHEEDGNCKYTEFQEIYLSEEPGILYSMRITPPDGVRLEKAVMSICRLDLNNDTVTEVYEAGSISVTVLGMVHSKLYFMEKERITEEKKTVQRYHLYCLDTASDHTADLGYPFEAPELDFSSPLAVIGDEIYYYTNRGLLMKSDLLFENPVKICSLGGSGLNNWFYDEKTDEFYFSLYNPGSQTGTVYVYTNGETKQVKLPHENIYSFTLTNSKIYYSIYNPIYYGISISAYYGKDPENCKVYDYSGGKIYCTDREDPKEAELVYDCNGEYVISDIEKNYCIIGNYLYFDEDELLRETIDNVEYTYFSSARHVNKLRVNLTTGEMKRIVFE